MVSEIFDINHDYVGSALSNIAKVSDLCHWYIVMSFLHLLNGFVLYVIFPG